MQVHRFSTVPKTALAAEFGPWPPEVDALLAPKSHFSPAGRDRDRPWRVGPCHSSRNGRSPNSLGPTFRKTNPCALSVFWPVLVDRCGVPRPLPIYPCLSLFNSPEAVPGRSKQ
jgi:hypothetical protein